MITFNGGATFNGGVAWALGQGEFAAGTDAVEMADAGGGLELATALGGATDALEAADAGGSAHIQENLPVESSSPEYEASATGRSWAVNSLESAQAWPVKLVAERVTSQFDFTPDLQPGDTLAAVVMTVTTVEGVDAVPSAVLYGLPQIKGRRVFQKLQGGLAGCVYLVQCQVTTRLGDVLLLQRLLPVRATYVH